MKGKRKLAILVLIAMFVTMFPMAASSPVEAEAAGADVSTNLTIVKGENGNELYSVEMRNGALYYTTRYYHSSSATISYHTRYFYFTAKGTGGNPTGGYYRSITRRGDEAAERWVDGNYQYETYMFSQEDMDSIISDLCGTDPEDRDEVELYVSQGFIIKRRNSASDPNWTYYENEIYNTLNGIQYKAKDPKNGDIIKWSSTTRDNFKHYFDCPLQLNVKTYTASVAVDPPGAGSAFVNDGDSVELYLDQPISVEAQVADETWEFTGFTTNTNKVNLSGATIEPEGVGGSASFNMVDTDLTITAHFKKKAPPTPTPAVRYKSYTYYTMSGKTLRVEESTSNEVPKGYAYPGEQWPSTKSGDAADYGIVGATWHWSSSSDDGKDLKVSGRNVLPGTINQDSSYSMYYSITPTPTPKITSPPEKCTILLYTHYLKNNVEISTLCNPVVITKGGTYNGWVWTDPRWAGPNKYRFLYSRISSSLNNDGAMVVYKTSPINEDAEVHMYYELVQGLVTPTPNIVSPTPKPELTYVPLPTRVPKPTPTRVPRQYNIQSPTQVPQKDNAPTPVPEAYSDIHQEFCYEGTQHICTISSCYDPVYHSHTYSCQGPPYIYSYSNCYPCSGKGYHTETCSGCDGTKKESVTCPKCGGTALMPCTNGSCDGGNIYKTCTLCKGSTQLLRDCASCTDGTADNPCGTCGGTGKVSDKCGTCGGDGEVPDKCGTCGGDGKVSGGTCGGSFKDSNAPHTERSGSAVTCSSCSGNGKKTCGTCGGDGLYQDNSIIGSPLVGCPASGCSGGQVNCGTCGGSGMRTPTTCSGCGASGFGSLSHTYSYSCSKCGASSSSSGTCKKKLADATCSKCSNGTVQVTCGSCSNGTIQVDCGTCKGKGTVTGTCGTCNGNKQVLKDCYLCSASGQLYSPCSTCGGDGQVTCNFSNSYGSCSGGTATNACGVCGGGGYEYPACDNCDGAGTIPNWTFDWVCGYTTSSIVDYTQKCGKTNGSYYLNGVLCSPVCDRIVTKLTPHYGEQILEMGKTPDYGAYATFISSTGKHGDQPTKDVTAAGSGFSGTKYNTWQDVTLSYGTYYQTAKNKNPATTITKVYVGGDLTVTFDANGGTVSPATKTVTYGETYGTLPIPTRKDYVFNGWIYNNEEIVSDSIVQASTDHTLIAWWESLERTVTFDPKGGTVSPKTKTVYYGQIYGTLPTPVFTGYTFDGWYYGNELITASSVVNCPNHPTLEASWMANDYQITFDANGGSAVVKNVMVRYDSMANNSIAAGANRPGYTLLGWYTSPTGGELVYDANGNYADGTYWQGGAWRYAGNVTVYAHWKEGDKYIAYAANGGLGTMAKDTYKVSTPTAPLKANAFTKKGYKFAGWNTKADGSGTAYADKATFPKSGEFALGTTTLYAQWAPVSFTIKVAKDDIRVSPPSFSATTEVTFDRTYTVPAALANKNYTITFDKNADPVMSTADTVTLYMTSATAALSFYGWRLYEVLPSGEYKYLNSYSPGAVIKNPTATEGATLILFPYWSGSASYIRLPEATCTGYDLMGFTTGRAYPPDYFDTDDAVREAITNNTLIIAPNGSGAQYQPKKDETLYAYYEAHKYFVDLIAETRDPEFGEVTEPNGGVLMTFDEPMPEIEIPYANRHVFFGYYDKLDAEGYPAAGAKMYYNENGEGLYDWKAENVNVRELYAYMLCEIDVTLDGRGATEHTQTSVSMMYGETGANVIPPKKTGYTFHGYYTGTRGSGKQYYNASGIATAVWDETHTDVLYAYWTQDEVNVPGAEDENLPAVLPADNLRVEVSLDTSVVHIYADDGDASTGTLTDKQPYQVSDVIIDGEKEAEGAIPSAESVAIRSKMGAWMFSANLKRISGQEYVRTHVTVPYRTQYENPSDETLIISERQTETYDFMVPKEWAYWTLDEGGIYFPTKVTVENAAMSGGTVTLPVDWSGPDATTKPAYQLTAYGDAKEHLVWPTYDADGTPSLSITLTTEEYIISDMPGVAPDVEEHLTNVCHNAAWADGSKFSVKSDRVTVAGVTVLSDAPNATGEGNVPSLSAIAQLRSKIEETAYTQTYMSGMPLLTTTANGRYETTATITYEAADTNVGAVSEIQVPVGKANEINVHTPVVCIPHIEAFHNDMYQCKEIAEDCTVLVLGEEGIHSDFVLQVTNSGYHSEKKGYGERDYAEYLAKKEGKVRNEVCFPFAIWLDVGNDKEKSNDVIIDSGEWYRLGTEAQRFYLPVDTREGIHEIRFRSVAINGVGAEDKTEKTRNSQTENYVATGTKKVHITGRLYDFAVVEVGGSLPWDEVEEELFFTVGKREENGSEWEMLPLRTGVHPKYRNVGGLAMGGYIDFRVKSIGSLFGEEAICKVVPHLTVVTEAGYEEADVYYQEESGQGRTLRRWIPEEQSCRLELASTTEYAVREWQGSFSLPDNLYIAETGTDVIDYHKQYGLNFSESFWRKDATLMLRFALTIWNTQGEILYYGMLPEEIVNNIWKKEAIEEYRYDNQGNRYEIQGGEVAVIYPGDLSEKGYVTNGIY